MAAPSSTVAVLSVADSGIGMSSDVQSKLFRPFFTTKDSGHGLGLAAVLGILRRHRAVIVIDSAPGAVLRLRILAQDVMIALDRPTGISALNVLAGVVRDLTPDDGAMLVRLEAGSQTLLARITTRSAQALALHPGKPVHAVLKAVSVAPGSIGSGSDPSISRHAPPARDSRSV